MKTNTCENEMNKGKDVIKNLETKIDSKDKEIKELKYALSRLTANNNEMLALLTHKVNVEESINEIKKENEQIKKQLTFEKQRNTVLASKIKTSETEASRLEKIIS